MRCALVVDDENRRSKLPGLIEGRPPIGKTAMPLQMTTFFSEDLGVN